MSNKMPKATAKIENNHVVVISADGFHAEWPIQYSNGKIAYDHPELVPNYIKPKVSQLFEELRNKKERNL